MNRRSILALMRKDIKVIFSSTQMWLPMLIVPLVLIVVLPGVFLVLGQTVDLVEDRSDTKMILQFLNAIPMGALRSQIEGMATPNQQMVYLMINYLFAPMFLMVPVMVSSISAASAFVGEKEKKTLETLLYSPMTETELFVGKMLSSFLLAVGASWAGFVVFVVEFMALGAPLFGRAMWPAPHWWAIVLALVPALSLLMVFLNVLVSAKVKGIQEAQQVSVLVILPLLFLVYGQLGGVVFLGTPLLLICAAVVFLADIVLTRLAVRTFNRDKLFRTQVF